MSAVDVDDWRELAECRGMDPAIFLPERGGHIDGRATIACARCPVRAECLEHAVTHREVGVWGGTSDRERHQMRSTRHHDHPPQPATTRILAHLHANPGKRFRAEHLARTLHRSEHTIRQACRTLKLNGHIRVENGPRGGANGGIAAYWYVPADVEVT